VFGRKVREAKALDRKDPTGSLPRIRKYEKVLSTLFRNYQKAVVADLKQQAGVSESLTREEAKPPLNIDPAQFYQRLNWIGKETITDPGNQAVELEIPEAYQAGGTFGSIVLGGTLEQRQTEWKKIADLIESNNQALSKVTDEISGKIRGIVADGVVNERDLGDIIRDIYSVSDVGISRALTIARTEVMKAVNAGVVDRYKLAGVEELKWLAAIDTNTCDECRDLDGKVFPIDNHPDAPKHPRCRCTWIPNIALPKGDWWEDGEEPGKKTPEPEPVRVPKTTPKKKTKDPFADFDTSSKHKELLDSDVEIVYVYDKDGNLLQRAVGSKNQVSYINPPPGGKTVHNHPDLGNNVASFSPQDVFTSIQSKEMEARVISKETGMEYSIKPGPDGWPSEDKFKEVYDAEIQRVGEYVREGLKNGSFDMKSAEKYLRGEMNNVMKDVFEKSGIIYNERRIS
jgi:SPP1 gp7 family putative phage head morphogenesis protein